MKRTVYPKPFKEHIERLARFCLEAIGHAEYTLNVHYSRDACADDSEECETRATIKVDTAYLWCTVTVHPSLLGQWKARDYRDVARDVLHEVCHLLTEPIANLALADCQPSQRGHYIDIIERQTQRIALLISKSLPEDWHLPNPIPKAKQPQAVQLAPEEGVSIDLTHKQDHI